ncbi:hypothetical protein ACCD10_19560 [Pseudomonas sp. Pseusp122]|uniref:hypothetical protein n=1 Tax=unclassified Pseudomonas TaxID=196821 RepID=UPI0039A4B235
MRESTVSVLPGYETYRARLRLGQVGEGPTNLHKIDYFTQAELVRNKEAETFTQGLIQVLKNGYGREPEGWRWLVLRGCFQWAAESYCQLDFTRCSRFDEMQRMDKIPANCVAVQGVADSQPLPAMGNPSTCDIRLMPQMGC